MFEESGDYESRVEKLKSEHESRKEEMNAEHERFKEQMAIEDAQDDMQMRAEFGAMVNVMGAIACGNDKKVERSLSEFNRLLNWHVDSRQIWKAGNSPDTAQIEISKQFLPDILENWVVDLFAEDCSEDDLKQFEELKMTVGEDAAFLITHIEAKLSSETSSNLKATPAPIL